MNFLETLRVFKGQTVTLPLGGDHILVGELREHQEDNFSVTWGTHQQVFRSSEVSKITIERHEVEIKLGWV